MKRLPPENKPKSTPASNPSWVSIRRVGYGAHGFFIIKNKDDLEQKYAKEQQQFGEMLIQEYIPAGGRQFQVEIVIDEKGEIANAIVLDKLRWYPLNGGSSTINKVVPGYL